MHEHCGKKSSVRMTVRTASCAGFKSCAANESTWVLWPMARATGALAIMSYQGAEMMMNESDTLKGVKIMVIKKDANMVRYHGKTTLIKTGDENEAGSRNIC